MWKGDQGADNCDYYTGNFHSWVKVRDEHFYLFALFKALYIKLVRTSKYGLSF